MTGVGAEWKPYLSWIIDKESSGDPNAKNSKSTATGLMQLLNGTWNKYKPSKNASITNPVDNLVAGIRYIKGRYGTPENAVTFWQANGWY